MVMAGPWESHVELNINMNDPHPLPHYEIQKQYFSNIYTDLKR